MTEFVQVNTAGLVGKALDWAVAESISWKEPIYGVGPINIDGDFMSMTFPDPDECIDIPEPRHFDHYEQWSPSRIWSQCGPLIHREAIELTPADKYDEFGNQWLAHMVGSGCDLISQEGDTPLVAACRAIVASVLGETVSVPKELCHE